MCFLFAALPPKVLAWGFSAHRWIQEAAIYNLPEDISPFFKAHQEWLVEHAVDADRRKHTVEGEDVKHYIDLDRYGTNLDSLQVLFPCSWSSACQKWQEAVVKANGIGPWNARWAYKRLVEAFAAKDKEKILRCAADLGHYIGDLHVPLHTTENYNGQLTGQDGIHGLWETQIPEQQMADYDLVHLQPDPPRSFDDWVWRITFESHFAVDSVLKFEKQLTAEWSDGASFAYVERGRVRQRMRSPAFAEAYAAMLNGQVERRMQSSVARIAGAWWWAWAEAGEPELGSLLPKGTTDDMPWWRRVWSWITGKP